MPLPFLIFHQSLGIGIPCVTATPPKGFKLALMPLC